MTAYSNCDMPAFPAYDSTTYPHAVAELRYRAGASEWYEVRLYYSAAAFFYNGSVGCVTSDEENIRWSSFRASEGVWSAEQTRQGTPVAVMGLTDGVFYRLWTKKDLYDQSGNILLEAGTVSNGEWGGFRSWLSGLVQGLNWNPFRAVQTSAPTIPQAYSYNGVKLDWLPERIADKAYIVMCYVPSAQCHRVFASVSAGTRYDTDNKYLRSTSSATQTYYISDNKNGMWGDVYTQSVRNNAYLTSYAVEPVWSNKNFYTRKNELYLKGIPPVVVQRKHRVQRCDRRALLVGWQLGRRLAEQRSREVDE